MKGVIRILTAAPAAAIVLAISMQPAPVAAQQLAVPERICGDWAVVVSGRFKTGNRSNANSLARPRWVECARQRYGKEWGG